MTSRYFTLVEVMVVVAIMTVLTSLAIPLFADAQLRARKAELATVVDGLDMSERAYLAETGVAHATPFVPDALPTGSRRPWGGIPEVGFAPDGWVFGSYTLAAPLNATCYRTPVDGLSCADADYCASGMTDLDDDHRRSCVWIAGSGDRRVVDEAEF